jgi:hypothetical protein
VIFIFKKKSICLLSLFKTKVVVKLFQLVNKKKIKMNLFPTGYKSPTYKSPTYSFYVDYERNIGFIKKMMTEEITNNHPIDVEKVEKWINSQKTQRRRNAARALFESLYHITSNDVFINFKNIVKDIYEKMKSDGSSGDVFIYVGKNKNSSRYIMAMIALYYIKEMKYQEPIPIYDLHPFIPIMIFDDCAYSGLQLHQSILNSTTQNLKLFIGVTCISEHSYKLIVGTGIVYNSIVSISFRYLIPAITEPDVLYYFAPYSCVLPKICLYFDYKIAEPISTFSTVLKFGPILPTKLNYDYETLKNSMVGRPELRMGVFSSEETFQEFYQGMLHEEEMLEAEAAKEPKTDDKKETMEFIPFISNLLTPTTDHLQSISYHLLQVSYLDYNTYPDKYEKDLPTLDKVNDTPTIPTFYAVLDF